MLTSNLSLSLPKEVASSVDGKRLALIGFNSEESAKLTQVLETAQAFTRGFQQTATGPGDMALRPFDMVVVNVSRDDSENNWITPCGLARNTKPLLFVGTSDSLFQRVPTEQSNIYDLLIAPWHPEEVVLRVYHILSEVEKKNVQQVAAPDGKPRVLVADDDPTTTTLVSAVIKKYGMDCQIARNGGEAVELARNNPPDAAILDVNMPHLNGFEVLAALKDDPRTNQIHVLMLTSRQQEADIIRGFGLGADDYMVKPFSPMELVARLKRMLSRVG